MTIEVFKLTHIHTHLLWAMWDLWSEQVNPQYLSVNWESGGGGAFAVIPLKEKGRLPEQMPLFRGHTAAVLDTDWYGRQLIREGVYVAGRSISDFVDVTGAPSTTRWSHRLRTTQRYACGPVWEVKDAGLMVAGLHMESSGGLHALL